jgi:CheY-like chemotaxis protein
MGQERRRRVLIVDDEPGVAEVLDRTLSAEGYTVEVVLDSRLRGVDLHGIDLALVDMFMPEHDGIEVILRIREASPLAAVVAMSGDPNFAGMNALDQARRIGADAALTKPFKLKTVTDLCADLLARPKPAAPSSPRSRPERDGPR